MPSFAIALVALSLFLATVISEDKTPVKTSAPFKQSCTSFFLPIADDEITAELKTDQFPGPFSFCGSAKDSNSTVYCKLDGCAGGPAGTSCKNITSAPEDQVIKTSGPASDQQCTLGYLISPAYKDPRIPNKVIPAVSMCLNGTGDSTSCDAIDTLSPKATPIVCKECLPLPDLKQSDSDKSPPETGKTQPPTTSTAQPSTTSPKPKSQNTTPIGGGP